MNQSTQPTDHFPPTAAAALERLAAVDLDRYARTRNSLTGAVSRLSPYITHGFLTLPEIFHTLNARHPLPRQHKFVYELGWREYARHLWRVHGDDIFRSLRPGILPDGHYAHELPADLREGRTGIPAIDLAVRTLYETGYLHNHVRMWLASYVVHLRKVSWRVGADWMVAHLLDGDLASNHFAWQWIAATASSKPYLFNADNVARYAPAAWHSPGTVIDTSYEALDAIARSPHAPTQTPTPTLDPTAAPAPAPGAATGPGIAPPPTLGEPPPALGILAPDATLVAGRDVWLVHPWALRPPPAELRAELPEGTLLVGVFIAEFHRQWPWSLVRWNFVVSGMRALTPHCWYANAASIAAALRSARSVTTVADPHFALDELDTLHTRPAPRLFAEIAKPCRSFSDWWTRVTAAALQNPCAPPR
jgi:deoxyribodipyrimidine photo-lyase